MKYYGSVTDPKDLTTKEYVDESMSGGSAYVSLFSAASWTASGTDYVFSVAAAQHGHGADFCADVWTLRDGAYTKSYGYPSTGWTLELDTAGNVTLRVAGADARFAGKLVIV